MNAYASIRLSSAEMFEVLRVLTEPWPGGNVNPSELRNVLADVGIAVTPRELRIALHCLGGKPRIIRIASRKWDIDRRLRRFVGLRMRPGAVEEFHRVWSRLVEKGLADCLRNPA